MPHQISLLKAEIPFRKPQVQVMRRFQMFHAAVREFSSLSGEQQVLVSVTIKHMRN